MTIKKIYITLAVLLILAATIVWALSYYNRLVSTPNPNNKPSDTVEIKEGASTADVADSLKSLGAIKSSWVFFLYSKLNSKDIKAGVYSLPYNLSVKELVDKLYGGDFLLIKITIPEGKRIEQVAALLEDKKYFKYEDILTAAKGEEGKLFPDTYYFSKQTTAADFVQMMLDNFNKKIAGLNLSPSQLVLASMVERESNKEDDKALIAGIFQNRINIEMKLESDPTVLYVHDSETIKNFTGAEATEFTFWKPVVFSTYKDFISPYNTYISVGLPPNPICSPGLDSLKAAVNPEKNDYYFFLHDASGMIHPGKNNIEHEANKQKYL